MSREQCARVENMKCPWFGKCFPFSRAHLLPVVAVIAVAVSACLAGCGCCRSVASTTASSSRLWHKSRRGWAGRHDELGGLAAYRHRSGETVVKAQLQLFKAHTHRRVSQPEEKSYLHITPGITCPIAALGRTVPDEHERNCASEKDIVVVAIVCFFVRYRSTLVAVPT